VNGEINRAAVVESKDHRKSIAVRLEPYQSCFVVFDKSGKKPAGKVPPTGPQTMLETAMSITGPWEVGFDPARGGPSSVAFDSLEDWTERPEEGIRFYSGIAVYTRSFDFPDYSDFQNSDMFLDLGSVKNLARVTLNGKELGILWTDPWRVRITGILKQRGNLLRIEIANLWINRLIGDESKPWDGIGNGKWPEWILRGTPRTSGRYTFTTHHYYRKGDHLSESGLIGPVRIETAGILK
jgi:hypothetical protein